MNIFYLKCLLGKPHKTSEMLLGKLHKTYCVYKIGECQGPGVGRNNRFDLSIFYFECLWESFKTLSFENKIGESGLSGVVQE